MSYVETTQWTCDYCEKQESVNGNRYKKPGEWVNNKLIWNEHYQMNVIFCGPCFKSLFPKCSANNVPPKAEFKKPFWKKFWS